MDEPFRIDIESLPDFQIVRLEGDLDLSSTPAAKSRLTTALEKGSHRVLVDTSRLGHVDTTGLGLLVWLRKRLSEGKGMLCLVGTTSNFQRLLELTGLASIFTVCKTMEEAKEAVAGE
ncbi:MAG: STAS domain-containing protein [Armatimonadetes bacterium]|nr:STAS domain-containing protein [Armatimonadota bacterium]